MHHIECFFSSCWTLWMVNLLEEMCNIGWLRTGNPLVDSVAEHQAASEQAYDMYLSTPRYLAFIGLFFCWHQKTPAKIFPATCFAENGHFSKRLFHASFFWAGKFETISGGTPRFCSQQLLTTSRCNLEAVGWYGVTVMVILWSYGYPSGHNDHRRMTTHMYTYFSNFPMLKQDVLLSYLCRWCISHHIHCKLCFHMHIFVPFSTHLIWYKSIGPLRKMSRLIIICGPIVSILAGGDCGVQTFDKTEFGYTLEVQHSLASEPWNVSTIFRFWFSNFVF